MAIIAAVYGVRDFAVPSRDVPRRVTIAVERDGIITPLHGDAATVGEFLAAAGMPLREADRTIPTRETPVRAGMVVRVVPSRTVMLTVDGDERPPCRTTAPTVAVALTQCGVAVDAARDVITPMTMTPVADGMRIAVAHHREETVERVVAVPFETVERTDAKRAFGTRTVVQKGVPGRARVTERVVYTGGEEVAREEIGREMIRAPQDEIIAVGTKVRLGKKHTGQASWYAYKGCDCAANPWLPKGSYVKVTNRANGKSVIVRINDRGPFVPGRIIDLDKVAFKKIAPLGAGVIDVIMEEVKR